jgi:hypothetical protein
MLPVGVSEQQSLRPCRPCCRCERIIINRPQAEVFLGFSLWELAATKRPFLNTGSCLMAKKVSTRRAWTADHMRTLKTLAKKKTHAARIAKTLKRTEGATRQKAFSLGLSLDSRA